MSEGKATGNMTRAECPSGLGHAESPGRKREGATQFLDPTAADGPRDEGVSRWTLRLRCRPERSDQSTVRIAVSQSSCR